MIVIMRAKGQSIHVYRARGMAGAYGDKYPPFLEVIFLLAIPIFLQS